MPLTNSRVRLTITLLLLFSLTGCPALDVWRPPAPTPEEYARGLIVLYPGSSNMHIEMLAFYLALKEAGIDLAIEVRPWGDFLEHVFDPIGTQPLFAQRAEVEAARVAEYVRAHPGKPVNLMTFSGGAVFAVLTAAALPQDAPVNRVILLSPGIWTGTPLAEALDRTTQGLVSYYSPGENGVYLVAQFFGTADGYFSEPAAALGFSTSDPRLMQIPWSEDMRAFGNNGEHLDYFFNIPWIKEYVVPWIITK